MSKKIYQNYNSWLQALIKCDILESKNNITAKCNNIIIGVFSKTTLNGWTN